MSKSVSQLVIELIPLVPEDHVLKARLIEFKEGIFLELPEDNRLLWKQLQKIVGIHLNEKFEDLEPWQLKVIDAWKAAISDQD